MFRKKQKDMKGLIPVVQECFHDVGRQKIDDCFMSMQLNVLDSMRIDGDNTHPMGHPAKAKARNERRMPMSLLLDGKLVQKAQTFVDDQQKLCVGDSFSLCAGNDSDDDFDFGEPAFPLDDSSDNNDSLADLQSVCK